MTEKELKSRNFFDEPASLIPGEYNSYVVPYNSTAQSLMFKKRNEKLVKHMSTEPASRGRV